MNTFEEIEHKYLIRFSKFNFKQPLAFTNYAKFSVSSLRQWVDPRTSRSKKKQPKDNAYIYFAFKGTWWQGLNNLLQATFILMLLDVNFVSFIWQPHVFSEIKLDINIDCKFIFI